MFNKKITILFSRDEHTFAEFAVKSVGGAAWNDGRNVGGGDELIAGVGLPLHAHQPQSDPVLCTRQANTD